MAQRLLGFEKKRPWRAIGDIASSVRLRRMARVMARAMDAVIVIVKVKPCCLSFNCNKAEAVDLC